MPDKQIWPNVLTLPTVGMVSSEGYPLCNFSQCSCGSIPAHANEVRDSGDLKENAKVVGMVGQVTGETESVSTQYPIGMIMEADKEPDMSYRLSMESGFKNSPMAKLLREYGSQDLKPLGLSTENKVQLIIGVEELGPEMIMDRGSERAPRLPRYHLTSEDWDRVQSAVTELQIFLQQAASLIEKRQNHFLVDPVTCCFPF